MPTSRAGALLQLVVGVLVDAYLYVADRIDQYLIDRYQP